MNISHLVRGMTGEAKPGDSRALELRSGQVVRGVVMSVSENGQEAVVQINGVPVKAVLETPMRPGQTTWMQVQGQQEDGLIMLKQSEAHSSQPLPTIADALKQAGLPDEPWARTILRDLQKSGIPLTRETMAQLSKVMAMKPDGVAMEEWVQTAALALKRNLPLTAETMRGLQTVLFGRPMHDMLTQLTRSSEAWLNSSASSGAPAMTGAVKDAMALVRTLIAMMPNPTNGGDLTGDGGGSARGGQSSAAGTTVPFATNLNSNAGSGAPVGTQSAGISQPSSAAQAGAATGGAAQGAANGSAGGAAAQAGAGASAANGSAAPVGGAAANAAPAMPTGAGAAGSPQPAEAGLAGRQAAGSAPTGDGADPAAQRPTSAPSNGGALIGRMLTLLGVSHEQQVQRALLHSTAGAAQAAPQADAPPASASGTAAQQQATPASADSARAGVPMARLGADAAQAGAASAPLPAAAVAQSAAPAAATESLKSTLLQLLQHEQLPPAVRDAAQQLVQNITGQQLLLTSDRSLPFAHVTLHVPFVTPDGRQTAAVHIQARQGRKGELDADNCRLWFDLDLKALGHTVVDVNVVDKLVALNIHHPSEQVQEALQGYREEIDQALAGIGYQLSAFRVQEPPEKHVDTAEVDRKLDSYSPTPYKGVDLRI
ncbi:flagellar hook-length control protein FliK [Paenibacillus sp. SC116]|uniref:flagellar hook-length control protein FliK n=1 Tax=Paenibacillus sp. SC116 TaxID=2968986 RepID=UPI00215B5965|nr:flagellar hook-length control protein FliK [Paenibacillus sp. SC116]MCR8845431.1 flagellar hook-length control protein FliK [Paenibacillus sp. SC116]